MGVPLLLAWELLLSHSFVLLLHLHCKSACKRSGARSGRQRPALFRWREKTRDGKDGLNAKGRLPRSARQVKKAWEAKAGQKKSPRLMRARANGFQDCSSGVITGVKQSARFR